MSQKGSGVEEWDGVIISFVASFAQPGAVAAEHTPRAVCDWCCCVAGTRHATRLLVRHQCRGSKERLSPGDVSLLTCRPDGRLRDRTHQSLAIYERVVPTRASSFIRTAGMEGILLKRRLVLVVDVLVDEDGDEA